jgi:hypothetical protein
MFHIHSPFIHGRSWAGGGGGGKMSKKDNIFSKKTVFLLSTGFKLLCKK